MGKKDQCKAIVQRLLGDTSANQVDAMGEDDCVAKCKQMVSDFLGATIADKEFSGL